MNISFKRIVATLLFTALLGLGVTGCNTTEGFGKDVEKTGESIQNAAK